MRPDTPSGWPVSDMLKLLELQMELRSAVLGADAHGLVAAIETGRLAPQGRLRIYRNHAVTTLCRALESTFPVVCRLVDRRFFAYAAHEYLHRFPPRSRCLTEYGMEFADFLAGFEPCEDWPYLADVARFEWALKAAATVGEASPSRIEVLVAISPESAAMVRLSLQPSLVYFASAWPIDAIWQANQQTEMPTVDLAEGEIYLEVRRAVNGAAWQRLHPAAFAFRRAIAGGMTLGAAATAAATAEPACDLAAAIDDLFAEGLVVALYAC
jgi:hypothetical protein